MPPASARCHQVCRQWHRAEVNQSRKNLRESNSIAPIVRPRASARRDSWSNARNGWDAHLSLVASLNVERAAALLGDELLFPTNSMEVRKSSSRHSEGRAREIVPTFCFDMANASQEKVKHV
jgi:hypothetical protein